MTLRIIILFSVTILVPTALLSYFGFLAVRNEKEIIEVSLKQKYQAIGGIVLGEIEEELRKLPKKSREDPKVVESILLDRIRLFQDEVAIFRRDGFSLDGLKRRKDFGTAVYSIPVGDLPYEITVFEQTPLLAQVALIQKKVAEHVRMVSIFSVVVLCGGLLTLSQLMRVWKKTEMKAGFIFQLAHDIRSPLTSIGMFSEMLQTGRVLSEEDRMKYYQIISSESRMLTNMVYNVLDFSRIESGKKKYEMVKNMIHPVVADVIKRFESYSLPGESGNKINLKMDSFDNPLYLDNEMISMAVLNLLLNAKKYSPPGSEITVTVSKEKKVVKVSIADRGIGIPKREQNRIFLPYYRGKSPEVKNREGQGLGLAIVRHAVLAHRGRIRVNSQPGKGSEFVIELPLIEG